jgi:hypothetical protein
MKVDLTSSKHVRGVARDLDVEVDLVGVIVRRRELVGIDELLG